MSVASSIPCLKLPNPSTCCSSSSSSTSSPSYNSSFSYRFSRTKPYAFTICCSQTEGPLRRPAAPSPPSVVRSVPPSPSPPPPQQQQQPPKPAASGVVTVEDKNAVTLEFQRLKAKELQDYFKQKKLEKSNEGPFFGFVPKNEISNGRWAMFGFAVGMLTEYATGSDFVDQVKILLSNFGIVDLE
ncbi:hypothetical protein ACOSP7_009483 [Xanthoceras sorbifolium]